MFAASFARARSSWWSCPWSDSCSRRGSRLPRRARSGRRRSAAIPFRGGSAYSGDFPDPTVMRVGGTFYAYSTTVAALNLPAMTSRDLVTGRRGRSHDPAHPYQNDAMPTAARGPSDGRPNGGREFSATWAPSVVRLGPGEVRRGVRRAARQRRPPLRLDRAGDAAARPVRRQQSGPLTCNGRDAIDPQIFQRPWRHLAALQVGGLARPADGAPDRRGRHRVREGRAPTTRCSRRARPGRARTWRTRRWPVPRKALPVLLGEQLQVGDATPPATPCAAP